MNDNHNQIPFWLGGVLIALILILIGSRMGSGTTNPELSRQFAPQPVDPNAPTAEPFQLPQVRLPELAPDVQRIVTGVTERFSGGEPVPALTPVATNPRLQVEVTQLRRRGEQVQIDGSISNIADAPVAIPTTAFSFRDSAGITYEMTGDGITTLQPGQSTTLDLSVPLPDERGLTLILSLPPDPPLEQVLLLQTLE